MAQLLIPSILSLNNTFTGSNTFTGTATFDRIDANTLRAVGSGGLLIESNNGTDVALFGAGGGAGVTFYGGLTTVGAISTTSLAVTSFATTTNAIDIIGDSITTGSVLRAYSNSADTNTRSLASFINDHASATGTTVLNLQQDSTGSAIKIQSAGNACSIVCTGSTQNTFTVINSSLTTGWLADFSSNSADTSSRYLLLARNSNAAAVGAVSLYASQAANGVCTIFTSQATTSSYSFLFQADALTSGTGILVQSSSASSSSRSILHINNIHSGATGAIPLNITSAAVISINFKRAAQFNGVTLWTSNGNTPNATLPGSAGDICIGADGGKAYYCTGTTNWTAM